MDSICHYLEFPTSLQHKNTEEQVPTEMKYSLYNLLENILLEKFSIFQAFKQNKSTEIYGQIQGCFFQWDTPV